MVTTLWSRILLCVISLILVGFGQPAWSWWCGLIASVCGFALFWSVSISYDSRKARFWLGTLWFSLVQLVQMSWLVSHPYWYIYALYITLALLWGVQFGLLTLMITPKSIQRVRNMLAMAGFWTLMEWGRLFILSGFSWNPVGIALSGSLISLQMASLVGVYGLSFLIIFSNLCLLKAWVSLQIEKKFTVGGWALWLFLIVLPYGFGTIQIHQYRTQVDAAPERVSAVLVQTAFPIEEAMEFHTPQDALDFVFLEWYKILSYLKKQQGKTIDLIAMPEYVVPYGTFFPIFQYDKVKEAFKEIFGEESLDHLPPLTEEHLAYEMPTSKGPVWMVNNAFWAQAIANVFQSDVLLGLEDRDYKQDNEFECYSSAFLFCPHERFLERYEKRVLVPMGEYIPFDFCKKLAASYGVTGSFTCGKEAKSLNCRKLPIGVSICYEETYGHLMRENRMLGAELLANLTNDGWYPHSRLPQQHWDHARLRTVEMGIPLIRSCNTGLTGALDCLGRPIAVLGEGDARQQDLGDSLFVEIPKYSYHTLYTFWGDWLVLGISVLSLITALGIWFLNPNDNLF